MAPSAFALPSVPQRRRWLGVAARVLVVIALHAAVILGLAQLHPELREQIEPLFVSLITPPQPKVEVPAPAPAPAPARAQPKREVKPAPRPPVAMAPAKPVESPIAVDPPAPISEAPPTPAAPAALEGPGTEGGAGIAGSAGSGSKPGGPVVAPRFDVAYLNNPRPEYPRLARRMGEQGRVLLHVFVSAAGHAEKIEIHTSSGYARLDHAARDAVQKWKFVPARQGDTPVNAWVLVPISFVLES